MTLSLAQQVAQVYEGGGKIIQLRDKTSSALEFYNESRAAIQSARSSGLKVIINDRVDLAKIVDADGVHLGQDDLPPDVARRMLGDDVIIGFSTHNLEQAKRAVQLPIDYLAVGPIFETTTKDRPDPQVGLELLRSIREAAGKFPVVAIGGITLENCKSVLDAGADAVAVINDLWATKYSPSARIRQFLKEL